MDFEKLELKLEHRQQARSHAVAILKLREETGKGETASQQCQIDNKTSLQFSLQLAWCVKPRIAKYGI